MCLVNNNQNKGREVILITDKSNFRIRKITRDKEGHYIMNRAQFSEKR